jgi:MinD-like ATPase involved in chromosome partitioning or flagellar assembly
VNKGVPIVVDSPKSGVAKSIESMADLFTDVSEGKRRRR